MAFFKVVPSVDDDPARLWDWSDPQFLRGLRPAHLAVTSCSLSHTLYEDAIAADRLQVTLANPGDKAFRWKAIMPHRVSASPASLYVFSPSAQTVEITSTPLTLHVDRSPDGMGAQGDMTVTVDDRARNTVPVQVGQPFTISADLEQGWNVITFALDSGNYRSVDIDSNSGDARELSFSLGAINIVAH